MLYWKTTFHQRLTTQKCLQASHPGIQCTTLLIDRETQTLAGIVYDVWFYRENDQRLYAIGVDYLAKRLDDYALQLPRDFLNAAD
jgi:hypothetical protein